MKVKVKICGIRSLEAAQIAISNGADFIGLNFVPSSKRYIDLIMAKQISHFAKDKVKLVGVFQNAAVDEVNTIAEELQLDFVQLHGQEDELYRTKMVRPIIKSIQNTNSIKSSGAKFLLIDRIQQGIGEMVDLEKAKKIAEQFSIFYAGGLTPDNVELIVKNVKPFAVDVAGGIETKGKEDLEKIKEFIKNAKGIEI